jgi:signal transduction histidine kinase
MTMRLGTRLTIYYASSIAVILVGFSVALYAMAAEHLYRQVDERIESALDTLAAAAEIDPEGVVWEPEGRHLSFGHRTFEGRFFWRVADEKGRWIDGSATGDADRALARLSAEGSTRQPTSFSDDSGLAWRAVSRRLDRPPTASGDEPLAEEDDCHEALVLSASTTLDGVRLNLRNLGLTLASLSLVVWTLAVVTGRKLGRIALQPLTEMADAAQAIGGDQAERRLPVPQADDELGELGRSFNALLDRLEESRLRQQRFTGDASHQLGTPLTAIQGHVDLALRADRSPDEYRRVLGLVQAKTRHLRQMVDGLMFLSRADAEARRPSLEQIDLAAWLREHLAAWHHPRGCDIVFESDGGEACHTCVHPPLLGELVTTCSTTPRSTARPKRRSASDYRSRTGRFSSPSTMRDRESTRPTSRTFSTRSSGPRPLVCEARRASVWGSR